MKLNQSYSGAAKADLQSSLRALVSSSYSTSDLCAVISAADQLVACATEIEKGSIFGDLPPKERKALARHHKSEARRALAFLKRTFAAFEFCASWARGDIANWPTRAGVSLVDVPEEPTRAKSKRCA